MTRQHGTLDLHDIKVALYDLKVDNAEMMDRFHWIRENCKARVAFDINRELLDTYVERYYPNGGGVSTTYCCYTFFEDANDAMLFKLRWSSARWMDDYWRWITDPLNKPLGHSLFGEFQVDPRVRHVR
jgi:hypothetical protein